MKKSNSNIRVIKNLTVELACRLYTVKDLAEACKISKQGINHRISTDNTLEWVHVDPKSEVLSEAKKDFSGMNVRSSTDEGLVRVVLVPEDYSFPSAATSGRKRQVQELPEDLEPLQTLAKQVGYKILKLKSKFLVVNEEGTTVLDTKPKKNLIGFIQKACADKIKEESAQV